MFFFSFLGKIYVQNDQNDIIKRHANARGCIPIFYRLRKTLSQIKSPRTVATAR